MLASDGSHHDQAATGAVYYSANVASSPDQTCLVIEGSSDMETAASVRFLTRYNAHIRTLDGRGTDPMPIAAPSVVES